MFQKDLCKTVGGVTFTKFDTICDGQKIDRSTDGRSWKNNLSPTPAGGTSNYTEGIYTAWNTSASRTEFFYPVHKLNEQNGPASIINLNPYLKHDQLSAMNSFTVKQYTYFS